VQRYQQAVFRLAYLQLGDQDDAADIAQETFIRAYKALDRFDGERPLRPWLLRIATNLVRNRWRFLSRYWGAVQRLASRSEGIQPARSRIDDQIGEYEPLWQAVNKLDSKDREVIYLRYLLEISVRETAEALGLAEGTIKSRTHRALHRLREALDE
jgi:RNA polymerase sigma-70 factor (ECF subfamily)